MTLTGYEHKKMICSAELESYQKRPVLPLSVTNELPIKTEHEKMSNLRNLFCMVALVALVPKKSSLNSKTTVGVNLEHYQKDDTTTDQLKWEMNLWSLAVTLLTAGNF